MGLAASQARLLTITARKSDCEFESMSLSHQKIALARDMERISDDYQKALNQTKLVYDYYGSGLSKMNLDYNLLMTPSVYNDYYPKLLTDNKNRVVLDTKYAAAARAAGIPPEGYMGTPSSLVRDRFIEALADNNVISTATAVSVKSIIYNNATGLGGGITAVAATKDITYDDLINLIKSSCQDTKDYGLKLGDKTAEENVINYKYDGEMISESPGIGIYKPGSFYTTEPQKSTLTTINLVDLLNFKDDATQYDLVYRTANYGGGLSPIVEAAHLQNILVGNGENDNTFLNWMLEQFSSILGGISTNDMALQYAYDQIYDLVYPNEDVQKCALAFRKHMDGVDNPWHSLDDYSEQKDTYGGIRIQDALETMGIRLGTNNADNGSWKHTLNETKTDYDYIGAIYTSQNKGGDDDGNDHTYIAINLNNLAKVFLTAYKEYLDGVETSSYSYNLGQSVTGDANKNAVKASLYKPNSDDMFTIVGETEVNDGNENISANFYDALFNMICMHGWSENEKIGTDSEYLQEMLKNGSIYISTLNNDRNYYQGNYSTDTYISEIADTDAISQAEAKYNTEKAKIESKENRIDVKMKNLDAEISALTTEYDTVKNIISKSVEKSFKRYDA